MFDFFKRQQELKNAFRIGQDVRCEQSDVEIRFMPFQSDFSYDYPAVYDRVLQGNDLNILENKQFYYPVFMLKSSIKTDKAILLLHGLNERSWEKYLCWAEFLCMYTQRPVILFPIAFHMNRSQTGWLNLRNLFKFLPSRLGKSNDSLSVANYVLSERLTENPIRFYSSGKQTIEDVTSLLKDIKSGLHPLFHADSQVDIFAYSIGAMITQILLMANPDYLFSGTRAFLFCGGSLFDKMNGLSRNIMDNVCYKVLYAFYTNRTQLDKIFSLQQNDTIYKSFSSMLMEDVNKEERYRFFNMMGDRMQIISLQKDTVIPYDGIEAAVGKDFSKQHVIQLDYNYGYSHEQPFPVNNTSQKELINESFNKTFTFIGDFFNIK